MQYGFWQGAERATGNIAATGMKLMEFQANQAHQQRLETYQAAQLKIAQDSAAMQKQAFEHEERKRVEQEKLDNAFVPVSSIAPNLNKTPRLKAQMIEAARSVGFKVEETPDEVYAPMNAVKYIRTLLATKVEFQKLALQNTYDDLMEQSTAIGQQIAELSATGKPDEKKITPLVQQQTAVKKQIADLLSARESFQLEMLKAETAARAKTPVIKTVDKGDTVDIYTDGVFTRTEKKGQTPGSETSGRPQQSQFVDPDTGQPLIYDPKTQSYKIAAVEGGGISPRPVLLSAAEREKTSGIDAIRNQLQRIKDTYKSKYVGLVSGRMGQITQLTDPDEAAFRQVILDVKDQLLRARSGAQINEQEYARLAKLVPDFTDSEPQFKGKMKSFETSLETITKEREKSQLRGGVYLKGAPKKVGRFVVEAE